MALDGIVVSNIADDINRVCAGGRITRIYQPEKDTVVLSVKNRGQEKRIHISANASFPLVYIKDSQQANPLTAPNFCMFLRKHIQGGILIEVRQPGLERILEFRISHLNELGDPSEKLLIAEMMGKYSNIIFTSTDYTILESIKHVSSNVSSVREVLPGRKYFIPDTMHKCDPLSAGREEFISNVFSKPLPAAKAVYTSFTGISPIIAEEICFRAGVDSGSSTAALASSDKERMADEFAGIIDSIKAGSFSPAIVYENGIPVEFSSVTLSLYGDLDTAPCGSASQMLERFYSTRESVIRIKQKSTDIRKTVTNAITRCTHKLDLQEKQLKDTEKRDKYRVYGEMINTWGYGIEEGADKLVCNNYYTDEEITVPLDPALTPHDNAVRYFEKYNKLKRTFEAVTVQLEESRNELAHLRSIEQSLNTSEDENDLDQIRQELVKSGYIKKHAGQGPAGRQGKKKQQKQRSKAAPMHYISSDGFDIYVGKNNIQNEELTFEFAGPDDWWFHAKKSPGSHVIVKTSGKELPDRVYEEAASLAAHYSANAGSGRAEIDYIQRKYLKKAPGAPAGFVIYHKNYSMTADTDISVLTKAD
ncbi:MAG: NFACT family protein [Lachnospiraceae bacterium]|nr:NFACT family protein [Lachnospiraceae bacterium]